MELTRTGDVFVAVFDDGENRIGRRFVAELDDVLDTVTAAPPPRALVTTGVDRFYSNGFDLEELSSLEASAAVAATAAAERLLARLLAAPFISVAAINGHCYAAGGLLALCHDFRVMRADRGFFCLPSVDVGIPFTRGMTELVARKVPPPVSHTLVVSGFRYGGEEAARLGIVTTAVPAEAVRSEAVALAARLAGKDPETLETIKRRFYAPALEHLEAGEGIPHLPRR